LSFRVAGDQGGVPAQIKALQNAVATLQTQLATVQGANSTLQSQVTGLQTQVSGLQTTVSSNDATLQNQLTNLQNQQTILSNTVTTIQAQSKMFVARGGPIGPISNNLPPRIVASVDVPAGNYLIYAVVGVRNGDSDDQTGERALSTAANAFNPNVIPPNASDAQYRIHGHGGSLGATEFWDAQLPLLDAATFTSDTNIAVSCIGFNWLVSSTIVAVNVGSISPLQ
jgi:TolA-binding protein